MQILKYEITNTEQLKEDMVVPLDNRNELFIIDNDGNIDQFILEEDEKHYDAFIEYYINLLKEQYQAMNKPLKINYNKLYKNKGEKVVKIMNVLNENNICYIIGCFSSFQDIISHYYIVNKSSKTTPIQKAIIDNFYKIRNLNDYFIDETEMCYRKEINKTKKLK